MATASQSGFRSEVDRMGLDCPGEIHSRCRGDLRADFSGARNENENKSTRILFRDLALTEIH
eukprot:7861756-Pyramimonas_sp.AAC.1